MGAVFDGVSAEFEQFWTERRICLLATVARDGTPHVVAVGVTVDLAAGMARVIARRGSQKIRNVLAAGPGGARVAVTGHRRAPLVDVARPRRRAHRPAVGGRGRTSLRPALPRAAAAPRAGGPRDRRRPAAGQRAVRARRRRRDRRGRLGRAGRAGPGGRPRPRRWCWAGRGSSRWWPGTPTPRPGPGPRPCCPRCRTCSRGCAGAGCARWPAATRCSTAWARRSSACSARTPSTCCRTRRRCRWPAPGWAGPPTPSRWSASSPGRSRRCGGRSGPAPACWC